MSLTQVDDLYFFISVWLFSVGYRYELFCLVKHARTPHCLVSPRNYSDTRRHPHCFYWLIDWFSVDNSWWLLMLSFFWRSTAWRHMTWAQRGTAAEMLLSSTLRTCECQTSTWVCVFFLSLRLSFICHHLTWPVQLWSTRVEIWSSWLQEPLGQPPLHHPEGRRPPVPGHFWRPFQKKSTSS